MPEPFMDATATSRPVQGTGDTAWLLWFCAARALFSMSTTTYSASLPLLKQDWHMSAQEAGLISSSYYFGFLISLFAVGFMADRIGAKRTYLGTSLVAAASALAFAFLANGFSSAFLLFGLTGLFSGGSYTPGMHILAERFPSLGRGRAIGFYIAASSAGYALSLALSSWMLAVSGWRAAFIVTCSGPALGMVLGAWVLRRVPNVIPPPSPGRSDGTLLQAVVTNKPSMLMILAYTFHSWEVLGLWAWSAFYLSYVFSGGAATVAGASIGAAVTALAYVISVTGSVSGGMLSDRIGRTAVIGLMSTLSVICSFTVGWLVTAPFLVVVGLVFVYQFTAIADSPVLSTAQTELVVQRYLGASLSLRSVLGFGAGSVSPWVFGLLLDWGRAAAGGSNTLGFGLAFSALGLGGMLCPVFILWLRRLPEATRMAGGLR
jgi:MFS family permease